MYPYSPPSPLVQYLQFIWCDFHWLQMMNIALCCSTWNFAFNFSTCCCCSVKLYVCKCHNTQQNSMLYYVDKTKKWHLCSKTLQKGKRVNVNPKTNKQKWTYKHKDKQAKLDLKTLRQTSERIYIQTRQTTKRVDTGTKTNNQEAHTNTKTSKQTITYKH